MSTLSGGHLVRAGGFALAAVVLAVAVSWSAPDDPVDSFDRLVNTGSNGDQGAPAVARDADGDFVVVWESADDGDGYGIFGQRYNAGGQAVGGEFQVNAATSNDQRTPDVAMEADGDFVVVWQSDGHDGDGLGVYGQRYSSAGVKQGGEFQVNVTTTGDQSQPSVAVDAEGNFVVAWQSDPSGADEEVVARVYHTTGAAQTAEIAVNTTTAGGQTAPAVATDASGNFLVAWQSADADGSGVFARCFDAAGTAACAEFPVNATTANAQDSPAIAAEAGGAFMVAWESLAQDGDGETIVARRFDAGGTPQGGEFTVNTTTAGDQSRPAVAAAAAGGFVVGWQSADGSGLGVYAQHYDAGGAPVSGELTVNAYTDDDQSVPAVAADADGDLAVAWQSALQDGSGSGVFMQRFAGPEDVDLAVVVTDSADPVAPGTAYSYTLFVSNNHAPVAPTAIPQIDAAVGSATGVHVLDTLPAGATFTSASGSGWTCTFSAPIVDCQRAVLSAGAATSVTISLQAPGAAGTAADTATISAAQYDGTPANGSDSEFTTIGTPTLSFSSASFSQSESGSSASVSVQIAPTSPRAIELPFTVAGTATDGSDFVVRTASPILIPANTSKVVIDLGVLNDATDEADETVVLDLGTPSEGQLGATTQHVLTLVDDDRAPDVAFALSAATVGENASVNLDLTLSQASDQDVTVPFTVSGTATGADFTLTASPITISAGQTTASLTLDALDDTLDEADETVVVTLGTPVNAGIGSIDRETVTIGDDDAGPLVSFATSGQTADEGDGTVSITVQLSTASTKAVSVPFTLGGTARSGGTDFVATGSPLTIAAGDTSATITLTLTDDAVNETTETVIVSLETPTNATKGTPATHMVTLTDDDPAPPSSAPDVAFVLASGSLGEQGSVDLVLQLSAASNQDITVPFTASGTAIEGGDYQMTASPIAIPAGQTTATITVNGIDDVLDELDENFVVTLGTPTNARVGHVDSETVTVADDDAGPQVAFASTGQTADEGDGSVAITVQLSAPSGKAVSVPFTLGGTARSGGTDFVATNSPLTIPAGDTMATLTLTLTDDTVNEPTETAIVSLENPTNAAKGSPATHMVTLTDDDPEPPSSAPDVAFVAASASVGESGSINLALQLSAASNQDITVPFTLSGTALAGTDYTTSASPVTIAAGQTMAAITITGINDALDEIDESFVVTLGTPTNARVGHVDAETVTITDDDAGPLVSFATTSQPADENDGTVTIAVLLSAPSAKAVSVPFTLGGTARSGGTDFVATNSPLTIPAGDTSAAITLILTDDAVNEPTETAIVTLETPTNATKGTPSTHMVTLADDDPEPPSSAPDVAFSVASGSVTEGGSLNLSLQLSVASNQVITVPFTASGTAVAGADYTMTSSPITIPAGQTTATITVTGVDDALDELDTEPFVVTLGTPTNAKVGHVDSETVSVVDNDAAPTVAFDSASQSKGEGDGTATVKVQLSAVSGKVVSVPFTLGGTARSGGTDFVATSSPVSIPAGDLFATITLTLTNDDSSEATEQAIVSLEAPTNATRGAPATHTLTITDNDPASSSSSSGGGGGTLDPRLLAALLALATLRRRRRA
jgi:hypothetical protein